MLPKNLNFLKLKILTYRKLFSDCSLNKQSKPSRQQTSANNLEHSYATKESLNRRDYDFYENFDKTLSIKSKQDIFK